MGPEGIDRLAEGVRGSRGNASRRQQLASAAQAPCWWCHRPGCCVCCWRRPTSKWRFQLFSDRRSQWRISCERSTHAGDSPGALSQTAHITINGDSGSATNLLPGTTARSELFSISIDRRLTKPAHLIIGVTGMPSAGHQLYAATRERDGQMWTLEKGVFDPSQRRFRISTNRLSQWQVLEAAKRLAIDAGVTVTSTVLRFAGVRASQPSCGPPPPDYQLQGDAGVGDANALIFACLEQAGSEMALHIADNRGIGMEFAIPRGFRVTNTTSPDLPEELLGTASSALKAGSWQTIPTSGQVTLTGSPAPVELHVRPTLRAFVFDLGVFALGQAGGKVGRGVEATANYLNCFRAGADRLGEGAPSSLQAGIDATVELWRDCGQALARAGLSAASAGAVFFGGFKLGTGSADAVAAIARRETATLRIVKNPIHPCPAQTVGSATVQISSTSLDCGSANQVASQIADCLASGAALSSCTQQPYSGFSCQQSLPAGGSPTYRCTAPSGFVQFTVTDTEQACPIFTGPGDSQVHSQDFMVTGTNCATGKQVLLSCKLGVRCSVGGKSWLCKRIAPFGVLGYQEFCSASGASASISWTD